MYLQSSFLDTDENEQLKLFSFYAKAPMVIAIIIWALSFLGGIGLLIADAGFGAFLLTLISGWVTGLLIYAWLRISYSYKLLHIMYQQAINNNLLQLAFDVNAKVGEITTKTTEMQEDISLLRQAYVEMEETAK